MTVGKMQDMQRPSKPDPAHIMAGLEGSTTMPAAASVHPSMVLTSICKPQDTRIQQRGANAAGQTLVGGCVPAEG